MTNLPDDSIKVDQADLAGRADGPQATPAKVVVDPEVMGGRPCFAGTRVPADIVMASVDKGIEWSRLVASYPFLTEAHVAAARAYLNTSKDQPVELQDWLRKGLRAGMSQGPG